MKGRAILAGITAVILLSLYACTKPTAVTDIYRKDPVDFDGNSIDIDGMSIVAQNSKMSLGVDAATGAFDLTMKSDGYTWSSVPKDLKEDEFSTARVKNQMRGQLVIECGDFTHRILTTLNSQLDSVALGGLKVIAHKDGFTSLYTFPEYKITIPIRYTLGDDYLEVELLASQVKEEGDYKLLSAELLPSFGAASLSEKGYMVVPDGSGAVIEFNNGKQLYNNFSMPLYGADPAATTNTLPGLSAAYMPVFGISKGENGLLAVIDRGDAHASVIAGVSKKKNGYNTVYARFSLRDYKMVSINNEQTVIEDVGNSFVLFDKHPQVLNSVAVRYYPLKGEQADYSGMAKRYRQYLIEEKGARVRKNAPSPMLFLDIYGSVNTTQKIMGVAVTRPMTLTTFDDVKTILSGLKQQGVSQIAIRMHNWSTSGTQNSYDKRFDPLGQLGGKKKFKALENYIKQQNVSAFFTVDITHVKASNSFLNLKPVARQIDNSPILLARIKRNDFQKDLNSVQHNLVAASRLPVQAKKTTQALSLNVTGIDIGGLGNEIYSDFGSDYSKRQQTAIYMQQAAGIFHKKYEVSASLPPAFMLPTVDTAFQLGDTYGQYDVEDYGIPFYQLACQGLVSYSMSPINLASDKQEAFMRSLEYGGGLMYTIIKRNAENIGRSQDTSLYSCDVSVWEDDMVRRYALAVKAYETVGMALIGHKRVAEDIFLSSFDKGSIIFNYTSEPYEYNGVTVAPMAYQMIKEG